MLHTFPVSFDHHFTRGGRDAFLAFADTFAASQSTQYAVVKDPVFTYSPDRASRWETIAAIDTSRSQIVYLSNVCMHSSLLVTGNIIDAPDGLLSYDSVNSFLANPTVRGYDVGENDIKNTDQFDKRTVIISNLPSSSFRNDDTDEPDPHIFEVLDTRQLSHDRAFACRILDYDRYFSHAGETLEEQTYFLPDPARITLSTCLKYYAKQSLTAFLLRQHLPFATIGDCHMDDSIVVTYHEDFWHLPESAMAFIR